MSYKLDIKVFRFDAKKDFLPYYKTYKIEAEKNATILNVLELIKTQDRYFAYPTYEFMPIRLNKVAIFTGVKLQDAFVYFSKDDLTFDPASEMHAKKDLQVDTTDFRKHLQHLKKFIEEEEEEERFYNELVPYYYASPTLEFNKEYFGDSFFLFAALLIKKYPHKRDEILRIAADEKCGVWHHTCIKHSVFTRSNGESIEVNIARLKRDILKYVPNANAMTMRELRRVRNLKF